MTRIYLNGKPCLLANAITALRQAGCDNGAIAAFVSSSAEPLEEGPRHGHYRYSHEGHKYYPHSGEHAEVFDSLSESPVMGGLELAFGGQSTIYNPINRIFVLTLEDGRVGVWKNAGSDNDKEVAASRIAHVLNLSHMVPPTVHRRIDEWPEGARHFPTGEGSFQAYIDNADVALSLPPGMNFGSDPVQVATAAAFDYLIGNDDRNYSNWMITRDTGQIKLIDHGLCFYGTNSSLTYKAGYDRMPIPEVVNSWINHWPDIEKEMLVARLDEHHISLVKSRLDHLARARNCSEFLDPLSRNLV